MRQTRIENVRQDENGNIVGEPCAKINERESGLIRSDSFEDITTDKAIYEGDAFYGDDEVAYVPVVFVDGVVCPYHVFWCQQKLSVTNLTFYHYGIFQ